jgi:hypothetical protein
MTFSRRGIPLLVRKEKSVRGTEEVCQLKWKCAPKPFCDDATWEELTSSLKGIDGLRRTFAANKPRKILTEDPL